MAVVKLAKVKLVHRGQYDSSATYRAGDIVSFGKTDTSSGMQGAFNQPVPTFIYKNAEGKKGSHPYVQTRLGTVPTLELELISSDLYLAGQVIIQVGTGIPWLLLENL